MTECPVLVKTVLIFFSLEGISVLPGWNIEFQGKGKIALFDYWKHKIWKFPARHLIALMTPGSSEFKTGSTCVYDLQNKLFLNLDFLFLKTIRISFKAPNTISYNDRQSEIPIKTNATFTFKTRGILSTI